MKWMKYTFEKKANIREKQQYIQREVDSMHS